MTRRSESVTERTPWLGFLLFTVSGFCAAVYQVSWQRMLTLSMGSMTGAVALSVAGFLAGLGLGGLIGGRLSLSCTPRRAWLAFCACEMLLGVYAWLSPTMLASWLPSWSASWSTTWLVRVGQWLAIALPATPMGATLPLLVRAVAIPTDGLAARIGRLFVGNTLGAAIGAGVTPWFLFPQLGVGGATHLAAGLTTCVAVGAATRGLMEWNAPRSSGPTRRRQRDRVVKAMPNQATGRSWPFLLWPTLTFASGVLAIGLELVWFRVLDVMVKSTSMTFGTALSVYLAGLAIGALAATAMASRVTVPLHWLLATQGLSAIAAALPILLLARLPIDWPGYASLVEYWRAYEGLGLRPTDAPGDIAALYFALSAIVMGPATILFGASFVWLQRAMQDDVSTSGWKVGVTEAARIGGNVLGSLLVGFVMFEFVGTAATLIVATLLGASFPLLRLALDGFSWRAASLAAVIVGLALLLPGNDAFWRRLHGEPSNFWMIEEDADAVLAAMSPLPDEGTYELRLSANGKGISWLPYGGVHTQLGLLPAIVHPHPRRVAVIGLGSGDTAWGSSLRSEVERLDVFEICGCMPLLLERLADERTWPGLRRLLDDPRVTLHHADGRYALMRHEERYDIIELDALRPQSAAAGNLYSTEFFRLCAARLAPRGIHCQWAPTMRTIRTFCAVYPYVVLVPDGPILMGSREPISIDLSDAATRLSVGGADELTARRCLQMLRQARAIDAGRLPPGKVNTDLFPRDEFTVGGAP